MSAITHPRMEVVVDHNGDKYMEEVTRYRCQYDAEVSYPQSEQDTHMNVEISVKASSRNNVYEQALMESGVSMCARLKYTDSVKKLPMPVQVPSSLANGVRDLGMGTAVNTVQMPISFVPETPSDQKHPNKLRECQYLAPASLQRSNNAKESGKVPNPSHNHIVLVLDMDKLSRQLFWGAIGFLALILIVFLACIR